MDLKTLYVFVEGDDDERFFSAILLPRLREKYGGVKVIKYAQKPKKFEYLGKFIRSICSMRADYILVVDIDSSPCVTAKKQEVQGNLKNLSQDRILVVVKEIEGWYLAGLYKDSAKKLGLKEIPENTNTLTKEDFNRLIPKKFDSRIDFVREILKNFSLEIAQNKNSSLRYCIEKYLS